MTENEIDNVDEDQHSDNVDSVAMKPSMSKMEAMSQAINLIGTMDGADINNFMDMVKQMQGGSASDQIPDGTSDKNKAGIMMKPSFANAAMKESIKEAIAEIFGEDTEELSAEFKEKTETLFEAALSTRLAVLKEEIQEAAEVEISEAVEALTENFDEYITYVAQEWLNENEVAVENALKLEIFEDFIGDLKGLFEAHYFNIPENKQDVLEAMAERIDSMETKLNSTMEENMALKDELVEYQKNEVIDKVTEGLVLSQKEKFRTLVEDLDFDPNTYQNKLQTVKTKYFPNKKSSADESSSDLLSEHLDDETDKPITSKEMNQYVFAASKMK